MQKKLALSLIVMILCAIIGIGWGVDQIFDNYDEQSNKDVISSYKTLGKQLALSIDQVEDTQLFLNQWNISNTNYLSLTRKKNFPLPKELKKTFFEGKSLVLESDEKLTLHYYLANKQMVLSFIPDELSINDSPPLISLLLTLIFYCGILAFILIWLYPLVRRLRLLRQSAVKFGTGQLSSRIKISRTSYIKDIETEFNQMAQKIEMLVSDNKLISSAVSHDLRTPLARLRFGIDILSETSDSKERLKYQAHLSRDIDEMQSLVEVLLDYAQLEQSLVNIEKQPVDIVTLVNECVNYYDENEPARIEFCTDPEVLPIKGDKQYLNMLVNNLINNAIEHSKNKVRVQIITQKNSVAVNIHDDGLGIPIEQRDKIFKPFIKGEIKKKGYGMGLAIAERICQWHNGRITIYQSTELGGAMFQVILPYGD